MYVISRMPESNVCFDECLEDGFYVEGKTYFDVQEKLEKHEAEIDIKDLFLRGKDMDINKEACMVIKTKFQDIREELERNYYKTYNFIDTTNETYNCRLAALKKAVDELLILLDKAVS